MYDLIVLGGGPGGYEAAAYAAKANKKVCLIEKTHIGGTCLNEGCIPLKYFLHVSKAIKELSNLTAIGVLEGADSVALKQDIVVKNKAAIVEGLKGSVSGMLGYRGVEIITGEGVIKSADESHVVVTVDGADYEAANLIIATGSVEKRLETPAACSYKLMYSSDMLELTEIPKSIIIVGGGVIGLEAASFYADLGSEVTIVEFMDKIGGPIDSEIEKSYERILKKNKVKVMTSTNVTGFSTNTISVEKAGEGESLSAEAVLIAIGRAPKVEGIGLENIGVDFDKKGIKIDDHCRTNLSNVYAIGDVTGKLMLAHTAYHQAKVATDNIKGVDAVAEYDLIPSIIYCNPEIFTVGKTEDAAKAEGLDYIAKSIPMTYSGRYFAEHGKDGAIFKMVIETSTKKLLGVSMMGNGTSELAVFFELLIKNGSTTDDIKNLIFPHPTVGEVVKELIDNE